MLPYQANSDAAFPAPALPTLAVKPAFPLAAGDIGPLFATALLPFFADFSFDFDADVFFGVGPPATLCVALPTGFGTGFGVALDFSAGVAVGFGTGVTVGGGDGNSISLFAGTTGLCFCALLSFEVSGSGAAARSDRCDGSLGDSAAARSPALPSHTMLSGSDEALAARLQRIRTAISAPCASAMSATFRRKGFPTLKSEEH